MILPMLLIPIVDPAEHTPFTIAVTVFELIAIVVYLERKDRRFFNTHTKYIHIIDEKITLSGVASWLIIVNHSHVHVMLHKTSFPLFS